MARRIAALRPRQRIIALTPSEKSYRQMACFGESSRTCSTQCSAEPNDRS